LRIFRLGQGLKSGHNLGYARYSIPDNGAVIKEDPNGFKHR